MAKTLSLVFGDVVRDTSNESMFVAVSGATALKGNKQFILFLKITDEFNCYSAQLIPHTRLVVGTFVYVKNIHAHVDNYLKALDIKYNKEIVDSFGFQVKKPKQ